MWPSALALKRIGHVGAHPVGRRNGGEPELPQAAVACRLHEGVVVCIGQRLEANPVPFQDDRLCVDHA